MNTIEGNDATSHTHGATEPDEGTSAQASGADPVAANDEKAVDSELMDLQYALDEAEKEVGETRDAMLRMQAEMENLRKRLLRDQERARKFALERIMADLLPVLDSLTRATEADSGSATVESLLEGKALILKMLGKAMTDHGLVEIDPLGEAFDPAQHEAMTMQPSLDYPENVVMEVLQKGFLLHERLLRPAMVVVSKGEPQD